MPLFIPQWPYNLDRMTSHQNRKAAKVVEHHVEATIRVQHLMGDSLVVSTEAITVPSFPAFHKHLCSDFAAVLRLPIDKVRFGVCFYVIFCVAWGGLPHLWPFLVVGLCPWAYYYCCTLLPPLRWLAPAASDPYHTPTPHPLAYTHTTAHCCSGAHGLPPVRPGPAGRSDPAYVPGPVQPR